MNTELKEHFDFKKLETTVTRRGSVKKDSTSVSTVLCQMSGRLPDVLTHQMTT